MPLSTRAQVPHFWTKIIMRSMVLTLKVAPSIRNLQIMGWILYRASTPLKTTCTLSNSRTISLIPLESTPKDKCQRSLILSSRPPSTRKRRVLEQRFLRVRDNWSKYWVTNSRCIWRSCRTVQVNNLVFHYWVPRATILKYSIVSTTATWIVLQTVKLTFTHSPNKLAIWKFQVLETRRFTSSQMSTTTTYVEALSREQGSKPTR